MNTQPIASEILDEHLSDYLLTQKEQKEIYRKNQIILELAKIAVPVVLRAADAGNMQCKEALKELIPLMNQL